MALAIRKLPDGPLSLSFASGTLTMETLVLIEPADPVGPTAQKLIENLCTELSKRYGVPPCPFSPDAEGATPRSVFLVARIREESVGCGAIRQIDEATAEIKRMYVAPKGRRNGMARRILETLERYAVGFGYRTIRLETGVLQPEAQRLYESCGYRRIASFGPYAGNPTSVCYEKSLSVGSGRVEPPGYSEPGSAPA